MYTNLAWSLAVATAFIGPSVEYRQAVETIKLGRPPATGTVGQLQILRGDADELYVPGVILEGTLFRVTPYRYQLSHPAHLHRDSR